MVIDRTCDVRAADESLSGQAVDFGSREVPHLGMFGRCSYVTLDPSGRKDEVDDAEAFAGPRTVVKPDEVVDLDFETGFFARLADPASINVSPGSGFPAGGLKRERADALLSRTKR